MNHRNDGVPAQHWLLKSLFVVVAAAAAAARGNMDGSKKQIRPISNVGP